MSVGMRLISLREICSHPCTQISHMCYGKGLQCCTGMPFTRDTIPRRRAEQESLCYSTVLWCLKALICISQKRNAAALLAANGFAAAVLILLESLARLQ